MDSIFSVAHIDNAFQGKQQNPNDLLFFFLSCGVLVNLEYFFFAH